MNYCGIYKITQKSTNKSYIGKSINVSRRIEQHLNEESDDWHKEFQNNLDDWSIEYIEQCKPEELNAREQYWINYYDSYNNGFNKTRGNGPNKCSKRKLSEIQLFDGMHESFMDVNIDKIITALMTDSCQETLYKILFIHNLHEYDNYKYWFDYADDNVYIIKIMPFKNKQCNKEDIIYICLDLNKKENFLAIEDILDGYNRQLEYKIQWKDRIYYIKNHGGYKCDWFWAYSWDCWGEFKYWPIMRNKT